MVTNYNSNLNSSRTSEKKTTKLGNPSKINYGVCRWDNEINIL